MPTITLSKLSAPGWNKTFSSWEATLAELKQWICNDCFTTYHYCYHQTLEAEIKVGTDPEEAKEIARIEAEWCIPDSFLTLHPEEQVGHLLDTSCGAEFMVEEEEK